MILFDTVEEGELRDIVKTSERLSRLKADKIHVLSCYAFNLHIEIAGGQGAGSREQGRGFAAFITIKMVQFK